MTGPGDDLFARLCRFTELRLAVQPDHALGCVEISVDGMPGDAANVVMAPNAALDLALRLTQACMRLQRASDPPAPGTAGPFSARF